MVINRTRVTVNLLNFKRMHRLTISKGLRLMWTIQKSWTRCVASDQSRDRRDRSDYRPGSMSYQPFDTPKNQLDGQLTSVIPISPLSLPSPSVSWDAAVASLSSPFSGCFGGSLKILGVFARFYWYATYDINPLISILRHWATHSTETNIYTQ